MCTAGIYVVAESWLNDLATNENRGRLMAIYSVVTIAFFGAGQVFVSAFDARVVERTARIERKTSESHVVVEVDLDGAGVSDISTGVGFYDHMLTQWRR